MIKAIQADITKMQVDAIVNPANNTLLGGGGCDGVIHCVAGRKLLEECKKLGGCKNGEAKITKGYNLPAKYVIHTVAPIYGRESGKEKEILTNCYINSFEIAKKQRIRSIAFPCIGTGVFRFPKDEAAKIAMSIAKKYEKDFEKIIFTCFSELDYKIYYEYISKIIRINEMLVNKMLHKVLGSDLIKLEFYKPQFRFTGEDFLYKKNRIDKFEENETLNLLKNCSNDVCLNIYRFLNFYYPRWIAFNVIKDSDDEYKGFSSNNELIIALTSIIDRIANLKKEKFGYTKRFINFLETNSTDKDINELIKSKVYIGQEKKNIKNIDDLASYIYDIRSSVVHRAELGGIYPYNVSFDFNFNKGIHNRTLMINPRNFRKLLWKAIFNHFGLEIIY
ncbi:macro domain-containing protein [Candidatus Parcubacteria bacterium]|nr:macro domain-containing protein [Candidatus Parcubacteria bacterium]